MQVRLYGGLSVVVDGAPVPLGPPKQRLVLAALAIEANHVVSTDRITDIVWGDGAPRDPVTSLQAYISNLRRLLDTQNRTGATPALVTQTPGYRLEIDPDALDLTRVERLVRHGLTAVREDEPDDAIALLGRALAESAAAPLPELADRPLGVALRAGWIAQRAAAMEGWADAHLALGLHAEVAATLPRWIDDHPHRERLRAQLALALYRGGRQVEALRSIDQTRRLLADEVGLAISAELEDLQARMLRHDPDLVWRPRAIARPAAVGPAARAVPAATDGAVPAAARAPHTAIHGRATELQTLVDALDRAIDGRGSPVVITGEPGIGKTRLVQELARVAHARGVAVGWGRCPENGASPPFWAANQITEQLLAAGVLDAEAFTLLPQHPLADVHTAGPERFALQVTAARALASAARPLLLVVDDVQWADPATLALIEFISGELHSLRALVVVTARPVSAGAPQPLVECLGELARQRDAQHLRLTGLDVAAAQAWLAERPGVAVPERVVAFVHDRSGGNPFYFRELVALLDSEGRLGDPLLGRGATTSVPAAVHDVVRRRVSRLPGEVQQLLSLASVIGRTFDVEVLRAVAEVEPARLLDLLDVACSSGLLAVADPPGQFTFSHALVAEALASELSPVRLATTHARVADAIETHHAADIESYVAELAHHSFAAVLAGRAAEAHAYSVRAARVAVARVAHEDAVVHWTRASQALDAMRSDDAMLRYEALDGLGAAYLILDDIVSASRILLDAARLASSVGEHVAAARSVARLNHASLWEPNNYRDRDPVTAETMEAVLAAIPDGHDDVRAMVLGALANELHHADPTRRVTLAYEAVRCARTVQNDELLVRALNNLNFAHHVASGLDVRRELTGELRTILARSSLGAEVHALACYVIATNERDEGRPENVDALLAAAASGAERSGSLTLLSQIRFSQAACALSAGLIDHSERVARDASEIYRRGRGFSADTLEAATQLQAHLERGHAAEVAAVMRDATGEAFALQWRRLFAWVQTEAGDLDGARATLAAATEELPQDFTWLVATIATGLARAAIGDAAGASASYAALVPFAGRLAWTGTNSPVFDAVDTCLARLAALRGDHVAAARHFADAIALDERAGALVWLARTHLWHGEWLRDRGRADDADRAFEQARSIAVRIGSRHTLHLAEGALGLRA